MPWPVAEVEVDERLVRDLLREQHSDLDSLPLRYVDAGFDNALWRVGGDLLVRIPRRGVAADLVEREQRWLPELAPRLPLAVPSPVRIGRPSERYPWPWSIVPWLAGEPGDRAAVTEPVDAGRRLARFLGALHQEAPPAAPFNSWRSVTLAEREETFEQRLAAVGSEIDAAGLRRIWAAAQEAQPHPRRPVWIHGDLHPANMLISSGTVAAVIDFGDLCAGDPATDVAGAFMLLPAEGLWVFKGEYPRNDPALLSRSLGWAALFGLMLLEFGLRDRPGYRGMASVAIERVLANQPGSS